MFGNAIHQFSEDLDSLREFIDLVSPFLLKKAESQIKQDAYYLAPILMLIDSFSSDIIAKLGCDPKEFSDVKDFVGTKVKIKKGKEGSELIFLDEEYKKRFVESMRRKNRKEYHKENLYKTSLISLISCVECFLSKVLHAYFDKYPEKIESGEKQFSFFDLKDLGTIDDARKFIIDTKIEKILRGSVEEWITYFKSELKLGMAYIDKYKDDLSEAYQRRNILVHNEGIVNTIYIKKVPNKFKAATKPGEKISVSEKYLIDIIEKYESSFILSAAEIWKKIEPENTNRGHILNEIVYRHLINERWQIAHDLSFFVKNDKQIDEAPRLIATINYWQSIKWQGKYDEIFEEIKKSDFSAKDEIYTLAKYALLDDENEFWKLLPELYKTKKIPEEYIYEWPLFRKLRQSRRYKRELKKMIGNDNENPANTKNSPHPSVVSKKKKPISKKAKPR
jgi:hypothetical protein